MRPFLNGTFLVTVRSQCSQSSLHCGCLGVEQPKTNDNDNLIRYEYNLLISPLQGLGRELVLELVSLFRYIDLPEHMYFLLVGLIISVCFIRVRVQCKCTVLYLAMYAKKFSL